MEGFDGVEVTKLSTNVRGRHHLALTSDGEVYSWGVGENGRLGHGDNVSRAVPTKIMAWSELKIFDVACGVAHR